MNDELTGMKGRLLDAILLDDLARPEASSTRSLALAAYRRGRLIRRAGRISALAALLTAAVGLGSVWWYQQAARSSLSHAANPSPAVLPVKFLSAPQGNSEGLNVLTDEELLAKFPPNSCALAEIGGRQVLIFADPELQHRYVHRPGSGERR